MLLKRIPGAPIDERAAAAIGEQLGDFLVALHATPPGDAPAHRRALDVERFRRHVLPMLDADERTVGERLVAEHEAAEFEPVLTHADLGPEHILVEGDRISGVLDWTDACFGDAAIDLAWPLYGSAGAFARAFRTRYAVTGDLARRALVFHALEPWHEVVYGLCGDPRWIESGLTRVRERLREVAEAAATMDP